MQRILLIGSSGYLGRTLMRCLQQMGQIVPTYRTQALFADAYHYDFWTEDVYALIGQHQIDTVVIAANMAGDTECEFALFKQRVEQLIQGCRQCRVVYISSDGIFGGEKGHYRESDVPRPITQYGRNLQYFEEQVQKLCADYCIIRPSYLYGYSLAQLDHRLARARERLLAGEQLTYFSDMIKSPMEVKQVAEVIALLTNSKYMGIVHVAGEAMSVYDFYREAMSSLNIPSACLSPALMPSDFQHPRDTSLDISLMKQLTGTEPLSVGMALAQAQGSTHFK